MTTPPVVRPGLPLPAAEYASQRGETLPVNEKLVDAREANPAIDDETLDVLRAGLSPATQVQVVALVAEIDRLRAVEVDRISLLEVAAFEEAARWDPELKYGLRRIDDDCYLPWSGSSDSPAGYGPMTRAQALTRGWLLRHVDAADARDAGEIVYNRAGPREVCLTRAALKEAYASREAHKAFRLTPDKIQCYTTSEPPTKDAAGGWVHPEPYWVPWAPDGVPESLPDGYRDRY